MTGVWIQRRRYALALLLAVAMPVGFLWAANPNERDVKAQPNVQDKPGIWVLNFRFKDPRLITVDIPGRGRKICWYLWYQVTNKDTEPHTFIPDFELVTLDTNKVHHDQVLPKVQEAIRQIEDPTGYLNIKNSVTIASEPIPGTKPNSIPRPVTGVAIWDDVDPDSNRFSVFASGLSNGWAVTDPIPPDTEPVVRRKTLQLNFKRLGDRYLMDSREIRFDGPAVWIYRGSKLNVPTPPKAEGAPKLGAAPGTPPPVAPSVPNAPAKTGALGNYLLPDRPTVVR